MPADDRQPASGPIAVVARREAGILHQLRWPGREELPRIGRRPQLDPEHAAILQIVGLLERPFLVVVVALRMLGMKLRAAGADDEGADAVGYDRRLSAIARISLSIGTAELFVVMIMSKK